VDPTMRRPGGRSGTLLFRRLKREVVVGLAGEAWSWSMACWERGYVVVELEKCASQLAGGERPAGGGSSCG
jgi:hypothetical protein